MSCRQSFVSTKDQSPAKKERTFELSRLAQFAGNIIPKYHVNGKFGFCVEMKSVKQEGKEKTQPLRAATPIKPGGILTPGF